MKNIYCLALLAFFVLFVYQSHVCCMEISTVPENEAPKGLLERFIESMSKRESVQLLYELKDKFYVAVVTFLKGVGMNNATQEHVNYIVAFLAACAVVHVTKMGFALSVFSFIAVIVLFYYPGTGKNVL